MQGVRIVVGTVLATLAGGAALASEPPLLTRQWTVTIGVEGSLLPTYEGSDRYMLQPIPMFDLRKAGTPPTFHAPRDGFGFGLYDDGRVRIGPAVKVRLPRRERDDADLRGLEVDWAVEAGAFVDYWVMPWLRARAELRQGFGGHDGIVSDLTADVVMPVTPALTLSGGPRLTLATARAEDPYYSISAAQAAVSGLPVYSAGGGVQSWGLGAQARYVWSPQWTTYSYLEYQQLTGDAADSPLVVERGARDQIQVGMGVSYSFDVPALW
jgi:outer membrane protein